MAPAVLRTPRILSYIVTWCLGVVAGAAALNGLVKSRHDRDAAIRLSESLAPFPDFKISISIDDALTVGGFLAAGQLLISIIAFQSWFCLILASLASPSSNPLFTKVYRLTERKSTLAFALACWMFAILWTFGTAVAAADYNVNRSADVKAYVGGEQLDPKLVDALQAGAGLSPEYWIHGYTKFATISPWPLIASTIISIALTFIAWKRTPSSPADETSFAGTGMGRERTSSESGSAIAEEKKTGGVIARENV